MTQISFWISAPKRHIKFQLSLMEQSPLHLRQRLVPVCSVCVLQLLILPVCTRCVYVPACWSLLQGFFLIFTQKQMIAFQWVKRRQCCGTMQHCCLCNMLNFSEGFCRHRLFNRFITLFSRAQWDPLSFGHYANDTDGFFHGSWYWPFLIAIGEEAAKRTCSMQPALDPWRGTCITQSHQKRHTHSNNTSNKCVQPFQCFLEQL